MIEFVYPYMWFLLVLPLLVHYLLPIAKGVHGDALQVTFLKDLSNIKLKSGLTWQYTDNKELFLRDFSKFVLLFVYIMLVASIARPVWIGEPVRIKNEGRDIIMVMDISTSMLEKDFNYNGMRINRLQAVKSVASNFIDKRIEDRVGLVLFGSRAYLQSPLTFDKKSVKDILWSMDAGMAGNSTAIGDALGVALKSVKDDKNKENNIIILLTDGENNDGSLSLPQAINLAKDENIKIYTIGVGNASSLFQSILSYKIALPSGLDEQSLQKIANETDGRYFRAENTEMLSEVYEAINRLEPQSNEDNYIQEIKEYFYIPLLLAIILSMFLLFIRRRTY